jgi:hypothetical protein
VALAAVAWEEEGQFTEDFVAEVSDEAGNLFLSSRRDH